MSLKMRGDRRVFLIGRYSLKDLMARFRDIGVHPQGQRIMLDKFGFYIFHITNLTATECNILKQEALACGAEAAVPRGAVENSIQSGDILLAGTKKELKLLSEKLSMEPFFLKVIAKEMVAILDEGSAPIMKIRGSTLRFDSRPLLMGILNVTPDSFSDGGRFFDKDLAIEHGVRLAYEGADIIDIGGESTRPGASKVSVREELERIIPVIKGLSKRIKIPISIDTTKSAVAERAVDAGASVINDISGLRFDRKIAKVAARYKTGLVLMHIKGRPRTMQKGKIVYRNLIKEITDYLSNSIDIALDAGVEFESIAIDPGIGFGKTVWHNISIIQNLLSFKSLKRPVLIGASRKSFLGHITGRDVKEREDATTASDVILTLYGADIIRVHNVRAALDAIKISMALIS